MGIAVTVALLSPMKKRYIAENFHTAEAVQTYQDNFLSLRNLYLDTPNIISIETFAKCDAKCNFCPYVDIKRIGKRMPDDVIDKIVGDIGDLDPSVPIFITPVRINEPFLDTRLFDIVRALHRAAPHARFIYFSNGSPLVASVLDKFEALPRTFCLSLSLNSHIRSRYEDIMQIPFERTVQRFDAVHRRKAEGRMPFWVRVTKVAEGDASDDAFIEYAEARWPLFDITVYRRATWAGAVKTPPSAVPDIGCQQWYSIGFYADGTDPFCVMDADGRFSHGDIRKQHLLEIYNHPYRRKLRQTVTSRKSVGYCRACPLMS